MRHQQRIYIQNQHSGLRNRSVFNVNTSSDLCVFSAPEFTLDGAIKIPCENNTTINSGSTGVHISTGSTIDLTFDFNGDTNGEFKYEVYKYEDSIKMFVNPPAYTSEVIPFNEVRLFNQQIPTSVLNADNEYLVKAYYEFPARTKYLNTLGKKINTLTYKSGMKYQLYDPQSDFYFVYVKEAETPHFTANKNTGSKVLSPIVQELITIVEPTAVFTVQGEFAGSLIITVNGAVMTNILDFTYSGNVVTLKSTVTSDDVVTAIYSKLGGVNIIAETLIVKNIISSGPTGIQGDNQIFFNTTTNKYELYTNNLPVVGSDIIVTINTATIANGVDFYQSTSDTKRIILEGTIYTHDIINVIYYPEAGVINGVESKVANINWVINTAPTLPNGYFAVELSDKKDFSNILDVEIANYIVGVSTYNVAMGIQGVMGRKLYYRVRNIKKFNTLCGDVITTEAVSEIIPLTISTNAINSY